MAHFRREARLRRGGPESARRLRASGSPSSCRRLFFALSARRAVAWLQLQGFERIGILGTSLGSCLAMLTAAHEPRAYRIRPTHDSDELVVDAATGELIDIHSDSNQ